MVQKCDPELNVIDTNLTFFEINLGEVSGGIPTPMSDEVVAYLKPVASHHSSRFRFQTTGKPYRVLKVQPFLNKDGNPYDKFIFYIPVGEKLF